MQIYQPTSNNTFTKLEKLQPESNFQDLIRV